MTDLDNSLRAMLRERARDISTLPADFADLASLDVLSGGAELPDHRPPRWWTFVAAAAIVAGIAGVTVAVSQRDTHHSRPATPPPNPITSTAPQPKPQAGRILAWSFGVDAPAAYQVMDRGLAPRFQTVALRKLADPDAVGCCGSLPRTVWITRYAAGAFDTAGVTSGKPVSVAGHRGYYAVRTAGMFDATTPISHDKFPTISWQYAPDSWMTVLAETPATQQLPQMLLIAHGIRPTNPSVLPVPLRFTYLPAGLTARQATVNLVERYGTTVEVGDGLPGDPGTTGLTIQIWSDAGPHVDLTGATPVTVGGRPGRRSSDGAVSVSIGHRDVVIGFDGPHRSAVEFAKILASVRWAPNVGDPKTWFAGTTMAP